ncbi:helix-turn-helix transcriptional regulator [Mycolicibacterium frederiksbergense]|uniref:helix-turn-helix transcriptional regulator n=1 Tax=Mycolicibacterium frederiksbergense TaxID=117567 RepID=UPI00247355B3|nr:LuxR C-terminal-related transcriptional regulator [Mycolicibacterium frederiksbergense]
MLRSVELDAIRRIAAAVAEASSQQERASEVLDALSSIVPYAAAQIAGWDEHTATHTTVASRGYSPATIAAANGPRYRRDRVWEVLEHGSDAVFWHDCPFDRRDSEFYVTAIESSGFHEGATVLLRNPAGGYAGMLMASFETSTAPADFVRDSLGTTAALLLPLVDRLAAGRRLAAITWPGRDSAALDAEHGWVLLNGDRLPSQGLLDTARYSLESRAGAPIRFLWRDETARGRSRRIKPVRVSLVPLRDEICRAVVSWETVDLPYGLTNRELDVLAAMTEGLSNAEIAQRLHTSTRTITTHVEHILIKFGVSTRTAAALRAEREGLVES